MELQYMMMIKIIFHSNDKYYMINFETFKLIFILNNKLKKLMNVPFKHDWKIPILE